MVTNCDSGVLPMANQKYSRAFATTTQPFVLQTRSILVGALKES